MSVSPLAQTLMQGLTEDIAVKGVIWPGLAWQT